MKYFLINILLFFSLILQTNLLAQEDTRGIVYYQQIDKFEYEPTGRMEMDQFAKTMPSEFKFEKVLHFDASHSLFEKSESPETTELSRREQWFLRHAKNGRKPQANPDKIYFDFEKGEKTELLDFMTRSFLVESPQEKIAWKLLNTPKMILEYTCFAAEGNLGENTIIAWFTPQIPVPAGPETYNGLPGMILAVEKDGETIYLATAVELNPEEDRLNKPDEGKKVTQEELDKIIRDKIEEFQRERGGRRGDGQGRRH